MQLVHSAPADHRNRSLHISPENADCRGRGIHLLGRCFTVGGIGAPIAIGGARQVERVLYVQVAHERHDGALGCVPRSVVSAEIIGGECPKDFLGANAPAANPVLGVQQLEQRFAGQGRRRIELALCFLDDDLQLARQLVLGELRVHEGIALEVHRSCQSIVRCRQHGVVDRLVVDGSGVQVSTQPLRLAGKLAGRTCRSALEIHVLQHMGDPNPLVRLVEVTGLHVGEGSYNWCRTVPLDQQGQSVGEYTSHYVRH